MKDLFIFQPFNLVALACLGIAVAFLLLCWLFWKDKDKEKRRIFIVVLYSLAFVFFFVYKYWLSIDAEYAVICQEADKGGFRWLSELPLQLCNINLILIPVSLLTKKKPLQAFCFFLGPIGAAMALTMPAVGFYDCSILLPRMLGYYITHYLVLIGGPMMCLLGFFRPKFKDFPKTLIASFCVLTGVSLINVILRVTKLNPYANYFYSMETEGNPILELLHSLIPYPYFYMLPLIVILVTYMTLVTLPFAIADKKRKAKEKAEETEAKA